MRQQFFGDSYDIVKQSFIRWLRGFGEWHVHPMFTEAVPTEEAREFSKMLGASLVPVDEVLTRETDRIRYLAGSRKCGHLFLDPDTGLRIEPITTAKAPCYLFGPDLISLVQARPRSLTLVFDQAIPNGSRHLRVEYINEKLRHLQAAEKELHGFAYVSHACFILVSKDATVLRSARETILKESRLFLGRLTDVDEV